MNFRQELLRKSIHLVGLSVPFLYWATDKLTVLYILVPGTVFVVIVDVARQYFQPVASFVNFFFGKMLRSHEVRGLSGSSFFLPASVLVVAFFPKEHAILSLLILTVSDTAAALFGMKFGRHKVFNKSWEGTGAFFVTAFLVSLIVPGIPLLHGIIAAVSGAVLELLPLKLDDNFRIPVGICLVLYIVNLF